MMKLKFTAAASAAAMLLTGVSAYAAELSFDATVTSDGTVTVEGTGNPGYVSVEIFKSEADRITQNGLPGAADAAAVGSDGSFTLTYKLDADKTGTYYVVVGNTDIHTAESARTKEIYFATQTQIDDVMKDINEKDADIEELLKDEEKCLKLQISSIIKSNIYKKNTSFIIEYLGAAKSESDDDKFVDEDAFVNALNEAVGISYVLSSDSTTFDKYLSQYAALLKTDRYFTADAESGECKETSLYTNLKSEMAKVAADVLAEYNKETPIKDITALNKALFSVEAVAAVNTAQRGKLISVIESYKDVFDKDTTKLDSGVAEKIAESMCVTSADKSYKNVAAVKSAYNTAYNAATGSGSSSTVAKPSGGGISGGGGISSGINGKFEIETTEKDMQAEPENLFDDLESVEWARSYINILAQQKIINGKGDGKFDPNAGVTREEFAKMLSLILGLEESAEPTEFTDVAENEWYAPYINAAAGAGLIKGYNDGSFGIGRSITREEAAVLIYRAAVYAGKEVTLSTKLSFDDTDEISEFAAEGVKACAELAIIQGNDNNMFLPNDSVTRAECAKMMCCLQDVL